MTASKASILLIDDNEENLLRLAERLQHALPAVIIKTWRPTDEDGPPAAAFEQRVDDNTVLVVTDYDLTTTVKGLFGLSIVAWCQSRSIPVGDFSRGNVAALPKEPNLFELRVPTDEAESAAFIQNTFVGFQALRLQLETRPELLTERRSLASVLSDILGRPRAETQFSAYMSRLGTANAALLQKLRAFASEEARPEEEDKVRLLTYVLGHVLINAVLKYPGPILSGHGLCAYLATTLDELDAIAPVFDAARYQGPFSGDRPLFWREGVDAILDELGAPIADQDFESFGDFNRATIEHVLQRSLARHACDRCGGTKGGFWCPFTFRPVCERSDCSVPASSWIPSGAQLSRVERGFYDEWAPVLGL